MKWNLPLSTQPGTRVDLFTSPMLKTGNGQVQVTMLISAGGTISNIVPPSSLSIVTSGGAAATQIAGPVPSQPFTLTAGTRAVTYTFAITPGVASGNISFSGVPTTTASSAAFLLAVSPGIIVAPPLTYQVTISGTATGVVTNVATLADSGPLGEGYDANASTALNASIGDRVWKDINGDGVQDAGESGLAGVVVSVTASNGAVFTATTDALGAYRVYSLTTGTYTVTYDYSTAPVGYLPTTARSLSVALGATSFYTLADFGLQPPGTGSIGDTVWLDADNGGTLNPDPALNKYETVLPGVGVKLYVDSNSNGIVDAADLLFATTQTNISGTYSFAGLNAAKYLVQVDTTSVVTSTFDAAVTTTIGAAMTMTIGTNLTQAYTLTAGQLITVADFGFNWAGTIGNYVWYDTSRDGVQNNLTDEGGAPGATLELYYDTNNNGAIDSGEPILSVLLATTSTGAYLFPNLPPGKYIVEAEGQAIPAPASAGSAAGTIGGMLPTTPDEKACLSTAGQTYLSADFGFAPGAIVKGTVFLDANSSGAQDPAETTGFAGVVVTLTSSSGAVLITTTAANGSYSFPPVAPGTYTVTYNTAAPVLATYPALTSPASQVTDLVYGQVQTVDFGRNYAGTIGDLVWVDSNNNGVQNPGEPGIAGATLLLYQSGVFVSAYASGPTGTYQFTGLGAGTYSVTVLTSSIPSIYSLNTTPVLTTVTLGLNQVITTADFGFRSPATVYTVTGTIVNDLNGDGNLTETQRITGVSVIVVYTPTGQSPITANVPVDASGNYTVTGIPSGSNVAIQVNTATVPLGYAATTALLRTVTAIAANQTNQNFGYQQQLSSLGGTVVVGINADGVAQTLTETAVSGVTITLRYAGVDGFFGTGDDASIVTTTNASGRYTFTNLLPGNYEVVKQNPSGYFSLADVDGGSLDSIVATLTANQTLTGRDFELAVDPADVQITKIDSTDPITAGNRLTYTIMVTNAGPGIAAAVVVTDVLPASVTYVTAQPAPASTSPLTWTLGTLAVNATRTLTVVVDVGVLTSGTITNTAIVTSTMPDPTPLNNTAQATTTVKPATSSVTGTVYVDLNGNGVQDPGDAGIPSVSVVITDALGVTRTVTTDASGVYMATNVPSGTAVVDVVNATLPAGYVDTTLVDPSSVTVTPGVVSNAGKDGYQPRGTVFGHLFVDTDGNGAQNGAEPNLNGVSVVITDALGVTRTVTSDASGYYTATVPAGSTTSDIVDSTLPAGYAQTAGVDPSTVNVPSGSVTSIFDDGYQPRGTVFGHLFVDTDGNGAQNGAEPNLSGVSVVITDALGVTQTVTSDASGNYTATVPAGSTTGGCGRSHAAGGLRADGGRGSEHGECAVGQRDEHLRRWLPAARDGVPGRVPR